MASCLPTGSTAISNDFSKNYSGVALEVVVEKLSPMRSDCSGLLYVTVVVDFHAALLKEKQLEASSPGALICTLCLIKA